MKKWSLLTVSALLSVALLAGCGAKESSSVPVVSTPEPDTIQQPESSSIASASTPSAVASNIETIYNAIAPAAGLNVVVPQTMLDVNAFGGFTEANVENMVGGLSIVGGDSGLLLVFEVVPGTAPTLVEELEAYRDSFLSGPAYEEFADAAEATRNARIVTKGDIVVYAVPSVDAGADFEALDAAIAEILAKV